jgi:ABC-2 type transport system permease protein
MTTTTYVRYEVLRNFRSVRFFIFSLALPLVLYVTVAGSQRHVVFEGVAFPLYFMTAMATLGTMAAVISSGARIAAERAVGWTRQMRITPSPWVPTSGPRCSVATSWPS